MVVPTVSVIVPAFRAENTISRAIDSILEQTLPVHEIIVVDDGSPDRQAEVIGRYGPPVILVRQSNRKTAIARNSGIERATGEFIAFLDADDYWEPDKLQQQLAVFFSHPEVGVVASRYYNQKPSGSRCANSSGEGNLYDQVRHESKGRAFLLGTMLWTGTVMVRRRVLDQERFVSGLEPAEDRDLWIRLASQSGVYLMSQPLATAVLESGSISRSDIRLDCTRMLDVVQRHRQLLGVFSARRWRSYIHYRWAAMEGEPRIALPLLMRSFGDWPAPIVGMPTMQSWGRLRRLAVLIAPSVRSRRPLTATRVTS